MEQVYLTFKGTKLYSDLTNEEKKEYDIINTMIEGNKRMSNNQKQNENWVLYYRKIRLIIKNKKNYNKNKEDVKKRSKKTYDKKRIDKEKKYIIEVSGLGTLYYSNKKDYNKGKKLYNIK